MKLRTMSRTVGVAQFALALKVDKGLIGEVGSLTFIPSVWTLQDHL